MPENFTENYPTCGQLIKGLRSKGVVYGIKEEELFHIVSERICGKRILIAEGLPCKEGVAGHIEILIDTSGKGRPKELDDGSVDHKDLRYVINVSKGDKLAKHIPPKPGKNGCGVSGKEIKAPLPYDTYFKIGTGTEIDNNDPDYLIASTDGAVVLNDDGTIEVKTTKIINGDIDYSTGNISFSGDLKIRGIVKSGFSVNTDGNLVIEGNVEDAEAVCTGNIEINGGAVGSGNGVITSGGFLKVRHLENFKVKSGKSIIVTDSILHSSVSTEEHLKAKTIIGGIITTTRGVDAGTIGAESETKTIIKVSSVYLLLQQKQMLERKIEDFQNEIVSCKEEMFVVVRDGMNEEGKLGVEDNEKVEKLKDKKKLILSKIDELKSRIEKITEEIRKNPNPLIKAEKIFPNTIVRFGLRERIIKEVLKRITISSPGEKIIVSKS